MRITEYSRHWYTVRKDHWRPNTQPGYYNLIEHHIIPRMSPIFLTVKEIQSFYGSLAEDGLSDRSIWNRHRQFRIRKW